MDKQQYTDLRAVVKMVSNSDTLIMEANKILGMDVRNPIEIVNLLKSLGFDGMTLEFNGQKMAVVTIGGVQGSGLDQHIAFLRALVEAIESKALDQHFAPKKEKASAETTKTPDRFIQLPKGRN